MDRFDRLLLNLLQRDAGRTAESLAEDVPLSPSAIARRLRRLREWFQVLYETLLGSSQGPRMGSFIALYGIDNSRKLIAEALAQV